MKRAKVRILESPGNISVSILPNNFAEMLFDISLRKIRIPDSEKAFDIAEGVMQSLA